ncbi:hypothetical protein FOZ60_005004 [Perkinsus olseni]|uniref:Uncharacterized protein n=1 Tax=Perkinsus olseni TaxID=32597 RepID=A0A7J6NSS7_PEROL|nr:hypothetical protein FOZ60_005004 [Perkinsus olseni]
MSPTVQERLSYSTANFTPLLGHIQDDRLLPVVQIFTAYTTATGEQREAFNFSKIVYTSGRDGGLLHSDILGGFDPHHVLAIDPDAPKEKAVIGEDVRGALHVFEGQAVHFRKKSREDAVVAYISSEWVMPSWQRQHVLAARLRSEMLFRALVEVNVTLSTLSSAAAADNTIPTLELFLQIRAEVPNIMAAYVLVHRSDAFVIQHYENSNFTSVGCKSTRVHQIS